MTTLPDTLTRLAELLPKRIETVEQSQGPEYSAAHCGGMYHLGWRHKGEWLDADCWEVHLEAALREECRARDWFWEVSATRATISPDWDRTRYTVGWQEFHPAPYSSVHALALAMLAALSESE